LTNFQVATFTHANGVEPTSAFVATINWGDGTTSAGTIALSGTTYTVQGSHTYSSTHGHTITTTVTEPTQAVDKVGGEHPGDDVLQFNPKHKHENGDSVVQAGQSDPGTSKNNAVVTVPAASSVVALVSAASTGGQGAATINATAVSDHFFSLGGQIVEKLLLGHRRSHFLTDWFVDPGSDRD
jgi:hypothetical protein